jgi:hypothetical protein
MYMGSAGLLAPILVLATVVERVMEAVWDLWERAKVLALEMVIKHGNNQAEKEKLARDPDYVRKLLLDDSGYKERKRTLTLVFGSLAGVILSIFTGTHFFEMTFAVLQIPQPFITVRTLDLVPIVDVLITGLIIGAGSQPAHAIINWIYYAQSVQKEVADLRKGDLALSNSRILNEILATLGVQPESVLAVLKLMEQYNVKTLDDLIRLLQTTGSRAAADDITAVANVKVAKDYLLMIGRTDLTRMLP